MKHEDVYCLPDRVDLLGGVRRPSSMIMREGEIKLRYEAEGNDFAVVCTDWFDGQTALLMVKGGQLDFTLEEQIYAAYSRKTGELTCLSFGMGQNMSVALARGFLVGAECLDQLNAMEKNGTEIKVVVNLEEEEPSLGFYEIEHGETDCLGALELVHNPIGTVGGREYLFRWKGAAPFSGIMMDVAVDDDLLSLCFTNEVREAVTFRVARYYDLGLLRGGDWDVARLGEVFEVAFPDCFS